jgi:hypothetical protein
VTAAVVMIQVGCTAYEPVRSPRISIVDGGQTFYKDGRRYEGGSGLIEAVQGNARAEEAARSAYRNQVTGTVLYIVGWPIAIGGFVAGGTIAVEDDDTGVAVALTSLGTALAVWVTSGVFYLHVLPQRLDAINMYNDSVLEPAESAPAPDPLRTEQAAPVSSPQ